MGNSLRDRYNVDVSRYLGKGERTATETLQVMVQNGRFSLSAAGHIIVFVEGSLRQPYVGKLQHPDFSLTLVEINPIPPENILDKLLDETGYFIIGCDQVTK